MAANCFIEPPRLRRGDLVTVVSPSDAIEESSRDAVQSGVRFLESLGLQVKFGRNAFRRHYYSAGTASERLQDLRDALLDDETRLVLCSQGGKSAMHLVEGLDYGLFRTCPKIIMGMSDITILLNAITAKAGLITYHGPDLLWGLGQEPSDFIKQSFVSTLFEGRVRFSSHPCWKHAGDPVPPYQGWRTLRPGVAEGVLVGGHVGCLISLMAAGILPSFDGAVLFLEGTQGVSDIDRFFSAFRIAGVLDRISGLILGWFEGARLSDPSADRAVADMVLERSEGLSFPILEVGEIGHCVENFILPMGARARVDAGARSLEIGGSER